MGSVLCHTTQTVMGFHQEKRLYQLVPHAIVCFYVPLKLCCPESKETFNSGEHITPLLNDYPETYFCSPCYCVSLYHFFFIQERAAKQQTQKTFMLSRAAHMSLSIGEGISPWSQGDFWLRRAHNTPGLCSAKRPSRNGCVEGFNGGKARGCDADPADVPLFRSHNGPDSHGLLSGGASTFGANPGELRKEMGSGKSQAG